MDDLDEKWMYLNLKEEALGTILCSTRFGRGYELSYGWLHIAPRH